MKRIGILISGPAVSLAVAGFAVAGASDKGSAGFGNHTLKGMYEFHADGVVEVDGVPTRGFWEVGTFEADGNGNITNGKEYSTLLSSSNENVSTGFSRSREPTRLTRTELQRARSRSSLHRAWRSRRSSG